MMNQCCLLPLPGLTETQARKPRNPPLRLPFTPLACLRASPNISDYPTKLRKQSAARKTSIDDLGAALKASSEPSITRPFRSFDHEIHQRPIRRVALKDDAWTQLLQSDLARSTTTSRIGSAPASLDARGPGGGRGVRTEQYKSKISDEMDLKRRIQSLEESMELHERMKRQALAEFEGYRQRVEDMQLCTEAQHTQRVVSMSREVEEMRRSFEEKLRTFSQAQTQFEQEKRAALEELKGQHRQEVQELLRSHQSQNADYSKDQEKLGHLHKAEVESLSERVEELKQDKKRLVEEYEAKLSKAQAFYERELEAMKRTQQLTADNLLAWKRTESELRREFQTQEAALQKTLGKLRAELLRVTEEARENREKSHRLQASLTTAESSVKKSGRGAPLLRATENAIKDLTKQLDEVTQNSEIVEIRQKEAECELEAARDRVQQQATEILLKASKTPPLRHNASFTHTHTHTHATLRTLPPGLVVLKHQTHPERLLSSCLWHHGVEHFNGVMRFIPTLIVFSVPLGQKEKPSPINYAQFKVCVYERLCALVCSRVG
ncbi:Protein FAM184A [Liparis tanakae]|uniref:Protein FAM184A n=1 Tax=Liparis tanakae TaxID=230148 RepID=A0A4Z2HRX3_9TELE|nr:Protein FAM184A [Liparis tanakae]